VPGNIRQAKTFVELLGSLVYELKQKLANTQAATTETTHHFVQQVSSSMGWETKAMQFCAERLRSLLRTLEVGDAAPGAPNPLFRDKNRHHRDKSQSKRPYTMWKRPLTWAMSVARGGGRRRRRRRRRRA
jgi:hypothetical protein